MTTERWKVQIGVTFLGRSQTNTLLTENVSFGGIFVRTDALPPPMSLLRVQFDLPPDNAPIALHGMVASTNEPRSAHAAPGFDLAFFAANGAAIVRWNRFVEYVRDVHPEAAHRSVMLAREAVVSIARSAVVSSVLANDVTPRGLFLETRQHFAVGTDVCITVCDPRSMAHLDIDGVVRRRAVGGREGIGIEYRNMTPARWSELSAFIQVVGASRAVSAELRVVRTPYVPAMMETLSGPGGYQDADDDMQAAEPPSEDSWTLPPGIALAEGAGAE